MARLIPGLFLLCCVHQILAQRQNALCSNENTGFDRSCSSQIFDGSFDSCTVKYFPTNSSECKMMEFGSIEVNNKIGGVILEPYIYTFRGKHFETNYTVLNVTFTDIKWKTMKFRFERKGAIIKNHCRDIEIAHNVTVRERSVLYYDCWWSDQDAVYVGENYVLDFRAEGESGVKRGQYYFTVPSVHQLSPKVKPEDWKPFIYIEIGGKESMVLHVKPAPRPLGIEAYNITVQKECHKCREGRDTIQQESVIKTTGEVTYSYSLLNKPGSYYFVVTPMYRDAAGTMRMSQSVRSLAITNIITTDDPDRMICIASITSVIVALLFACYLFLLYLRRYLCMPPTYRLALDEDPTRILVLYSPSDKAHGDCVKSLVHYLRYDIGLSVMYENDIALTRHRDPFVWYKQAFDSVHIVVNIVGPMEDPNQNKITANRNIDQLQMTFLKESRTHKQVVNVFFDYSNAPVPTETLNDKGFYLLKDMDKMLQYLTKNKIPKVYLFRTDRGRRLQNSVKDAKKHFKQKSPFQVVVKDVEIGGIDKKALL